jgi:hypothetical protein
MVMEIKDVQRENAFMVAMYSFIPLDGIKRKYKKAFVGLEPTKPSNLIKYTKARYSIIELIEANSMVKSEKDFKWKKVEMENVDIPEFHFDYRYKQKVYERFVTLKFWIINFKSSLNNKGRYYLVASTCINKAFTHQPPESPLNQNDLCSLQDVVHLKQSFYGGDEEREMYYQNEKGKHVSVLRKLDEVILEITGKDSIRKYGRHYILDVYGVDIKSKTSVGSFDDLERLFSKAYYSNDTPSYKEVIVDYDKLTYGLIYGNENCDVLPSDTTTCALAGGFSNNKSERLFAGHKTLVYLHTHHPYEWEPEKENWTKSIKNNFDIISGNFLLYDICLVMEAKIKLKAIQENLSKKHPSDIKGALSSMSGYLNVNPYHLGEYGRRTKYIYRTMGVKDLWGTVMTQGNLSSSAREIELNEHLSHRVYTLTAITVVIGALSLLVSILCCNNSFFSSDMSNCLFGSAEFQGSCCAVVGCLLFIVLAASIVTMAVYQVKSFYKLKDIEGEINNQNK